MRKKHAMTKSSHGFTIVESMIVIALMSFLAVLAYPSYREYVVRSKVASATSLFPVYWNFCKEYHSETTLMPEPDVLFTNFNLPASEIDPGANAIQSNNLSWRNVSAFRYQKNSNTDILMSFFIEDDLIPTTPWLEYRCTLTDDIFSCTCGSKITYEIWQYLPEKCRNEI